ncbi:MAG: type I-C CRISPR-associated protein Cas7/Csd2 [Candidatus Brocadiia bacterium]
MDYPEQLTDVSRRMDFVLLFDVTDGNPNGDPDAGNLPRVDPETMQGLVTDVCLKRKVRNYVKATAGDDPGMEIYVKMHGVLNEQHERAYAEEGKEPTKKPDEETQNTVRSRMCRMFYDVRSFGAVMTTGVNCGQVRGPLQLTFARSIDPVVPMDVSITRVAVTRGEDKEKELEGGDTETTGKVTEMGRKSIIPYGLYRCHGFFNPNLASDTGFDGEDLALFWDSLQMMWELDRSASRGLMACRGLYVFSHDSALGNAPAHTLFDRVEVEAVNGDDPAREFSDYEVSVDTDDLPSGVTLHDVL